MHADLYKFFRAAFSAHQFRGWVRRLSPEGPALAQALPGEPVDALTLFDHGADLLIRQNYVDAALFTALASEFPRRQVELAELARRCGVRWTPALTPPPPITRRGWVGLTLVLCLAAIVGQQMWLVSANGEPAKIELVDPDTIPVAATIVVPPADPPPQLVPAKPITKPRHPITQIQDPDPVRPKPDLPEPEPHSPPPPPTVPPACAIPEALRAELRDLGRTTLVNPGLSKEFTVTLPSGASRPRVSPKPRPGETAIERLYTHLTNLSAADLGDCRDRSIDVYFSADETTVEFHQ